MHADTRGNTEATISGQHRKTQHPEPSKPTTDGKSDKASLKATDFSFEAPDVKALRGDMGRPVLEKRLLRHGGTHEALKKEYRGRIWGRYGSLDFPCVISFENMSSTSPAMQETPRFT